MALASKSGRSSKSPAGKGLSSTKASKLAFGTMLDADLVESVRTFRTKSVLEVGKRLGLTSGKTQTIGGRVNPELVKQAKERTGITSDSALIELALTTLVVDDSFAETFAALHGSVDPDMDLTL